MYEDEKPAVIELDVTEAEASLKSLRNELKKLKDQMAGLDEGSDAFLEAADKAGELKHQLDEINQSVKGASADFGDRLGNITKSLAGLAGGVQVITTSFKMLGLESESALKAVQKLQQSMAIVQGLSSIDEGIKALNKLRTSIKGTTAAAKVLRGVLTPKTLLILIGVISALVTIWNKFGDSIEKALPFITKIKEAFGELGKSAEDASAAQEEYLRRVTTAQGKVNEFYKNQNISKLNKDAKKEYDDLKDAVEGYTLEIAALVEQQSKEGISQKSWQELQDKGLEIEQKRLEAANRMSEILADENSYIEENTKKTDENNKAKDEAAKKLEEAYRLRKAKAEATYEKEEELNNELLIIERERLRDLEVGTEAYYNQLVKIRDAEKKLVTAKYDDEITLLDKNNTEQILALQLQLRNKEITLEEFNTRSQEINENYKNDYIDTLQFLLEQDTLNIEQREALQKRLFDATRPESTETDENKIEGEDAELQKMLVRYALIEDSYGVHLEKMQQKLEEGLQKQLITEKTYQEASKKLAREKAQYQITCSAQALNGMADILNSFAAMEDTNNKEGFERSKKLQIAAATIQMLTGITTAISGAFTTKTGPWDIALAAIQAAAIAASGAASIVNIKRQTYNGGGSSTATPSTSSISSVVTPPMQFSSEVQGSNIESALKDTKVYVTETDLKQTANKVSVQETENTY